MKTANLLLIGLITSAILVSCENAKKEKTEPQSKETQSPAPKRLLNLVSINKTDTAVTITYFTESTNWDTLRNALIQESARLDSGITFYFICFDDLHNTPDVTTDANAWSDPMFDKYRICELDNGLAGLRFAYGGTGTGEGRSGDWAHIAFYNAESGNWEESQ